MFSVLNNDGDILKFNISQINNNTTILDKAHNWNALLFKETLMIKQHKSSLNSALKATKDLQLF